MVPGEPVALSETGGDLADGVVVAAVLATPTAPAHDAGASVLKALEARLEAADEHLLGTWKEMIAESLRASQALLEQNAGLSPTETALNLARSSGLTNAALLVAVIRQNEVLAGLLERLSPLPGREPAPEGSEDPLLPAHRHDQLWQRLGLTQGERRRVTVLFADVSGFTAMAETMDPEECNLVMRDAMAELSAIIQRHDGYVEKFIGDAICAIFGAPVSHEDEPERAARAALEMHAALANRALRQPELPELSLHIGINTGLVVAGTVGDGTQFGVMGDTINTAARLMDKASKHQTFVSAETARRIRHSFLLEDMGAFKMKGKDRPVPGFNVARPLSASEVSATHQLRAPLVGRAPEMEILQSLAASAAEGGGRTALLTGDHGLGKTRLVEELAQVLKGRMVVRRASARAHGSRPFEPVAAALAPVLKAMESGPDGEVARLLLEGTSGAIPTDLPLAVARALVEHSRQQPMAVLFDNFEHADRGSVDLVRFLTRATRDGRVLWVVAATPQSPVVDALDTATTVELDPLSPAATRDLLAGLLPGALDPPLCSRLAERAGGNPEFAEEIAASLVEEGVVIEMDGQWRLVGNPEGVHIPGSVQEMIEARIGALPDPARVTLQDAAVIGVRFERALLEMVASAASTLDAALAELVTAGFIGTHPPTGDAGAVYWFKSPLVREVAYHSILRRRRRTGHRKVAEAILRLHSDREEELAEVLAFHFEQAEVGHLAAQYLALALKHAEEVHAFPSAAELAARVLELRAGGGAAISDDTAATLLERRAEYRAVLGDWAGSTSDLETAITLRNGRGQAAQAAGLEAVLSWYLALAHRPEAALGRADHALALAQEHGADRVAPAVQLTRHLVSAAGGELAGPLAALPDLVAEARAASDAGLEAAAEAAWGGIELWRGEPALALEHLGRAQALASEHRLFLSLSLVRSWQLEAEVELGRYAEALELGLKLLAWDEEEGDFLAGGRVACALSALYRELGQLAQAEHYAHRALELAADHETARGNKAAVLITLAECQLERGVVADARQALTGVPALLEADAWLQWWLEARFEFTRGRAALFENDGEGAAAAGRRMRECLGTTGRRSDLVRADTLEGEARARLGDPAAGRMLERALSDATALGSPFLIVQVGMAVARALPERASAAQAAVSGALRAIAAAAPSPLGVDLGQSGMVEGPLGEESASDRLAASESGGGNE
jgi:class 3 adenylate cyclase